VGGLIREKANGSAEISGQLLVVGAVVGMRKARGIYRAKKGHTPNMVRLIKS
jgi:hypothetical protein